MTYEHLSYKPTQEEYLRDLISHYDDILLNSYWTWVHDFVAEQQNICKHQLRKIKESDIQAILWASASASRSRFMNSTC